MTDKDKELVRKAQLLWWDSAEFDELFEQAETKECREALMQRYRWTYHHDEISAGME